MGTLFRTRAALETATRAVVALRKPLVRMALERIPPPPVVAVCLQARAPFGSVSLQAARQHPPSFELFGIGCGVGPSAVLHTAVPENTQLGVHGTPLVVHAGGCERARRRPTAAARCTIRGAAGSNVYHRGVRPRPGVVRDGTTAGECATSETRDSTRPSSIRCGRCPHTEGPAVHSHPLSPGRASGARNTCPVFAGQRSVYGTVCQAGCAFGGHSPRTPYAGGGRIGGPHAPGVRSLGRRHRRRLVVGHRVSDVGSGDGGPPGGPRSRPSPRPRPRACLRPRCDAASQGGAWYSAA